MRIGTPDFMPAAEFDRSLPVAATRVMIRERADLDSKAPLWTRVCVGLGLALLVAASVFVVVWGEF